MRVGREMILRVSGLLVMAGIWQLAGYMNRSPALPPLSKVLHTMYYFIRDGTFIRHAGASLTIILYGIGIAVLFGFILGLLLFRYESFRASALPVVECIRSVAALTLFPLLIVLFGIGTFSRAFVIFWTAWPAVVISTMHSLNVDESVIGAAQTAGAGEWQIIFCIRIPMAAQGIITGIRIGVGGGWIGLIAAEMLGATQGLGYFLLWSAQSFRFDRVYASIIVIAAIGGLMNLLLLLAQKQVMKITGVM